MPRKVILGTPCYDGRVDCHFMYATIESVKLCAKQGIELLPIQVCHDALIQRARNDLVAMALEAQATDLIFMDSDQVWEPQWIPTLLKHPVDVVGGTVPKKSDVTMFNVKALRTGLHREQNGLMEVECVGTGFLRVSRKALLSVSNSSKEYRNEGKVRRMVFDITVDAAGELVSEDNVFCQKWRGLGGKVWIDPSMTCEHIGTKKWGGNFLSFLDSLEKQPLRRVA